MAKLYRCENEYGKEGKPPCKLAQSGDLIKIDDGAVMLDSAPLCPNDECGLAMVFVRDDAGGGVGGGVGGGIPKPLIFIGGGAVLLIGLVLAALFLFRPCKPEISGLPPIVNFSEVGMGQVGEQRIHVINNGKCDLEISELRFDASVFTAESPRATIAPEERHSFKLKFSPTSTEKFTGQLVVVSNDPEFPEVAINLAGTGSGVVDPHSVWDALDKTSTILD